VNCDIRFAVSFLPYQTLGTLKHSANLATSYTKLPTQGGVVHRQRPGAVMLSVIVSEFPALGGLTDSKTITNSVTGGPNCF
jgi:hypothetical protein